MALSNLVSVVEEFLLYGNSREILAMDLDTFKRTDDQTIIFPIRAAKNIIRCLDFDYQNEWIYFSEDDKLLRTKRNGIGENLFSSVAIMLTLLLISLS